MSENFRVDPTRAENRLYSGIAKPTHGYVLQFVNFPEMAGVALDLILKLSDKVTMASMQGLYSP